MESPISDNPCPSVPKRTRRGGRRPGAGAPRGNMNALKTGAYSRQFALLGRLLAADPRVRATLLAIGARADRKVNKANELAAFLLTRYAQHVEDRAARAAAAARNPRAKGPVRAKQPVLSRADGPVLPALSGAEGSPAEGPDRLNLQLPVDDWDSIKEAAAHYEQKLLK